MGATYVVWLSGAMAPPARVACVLVGAAFPVLSSSSEEDETYSKSNSSPSSGAAAGGLLTGAVAGAGGLLTGTEGLDRERGAILGISIEDVAESLLIYNLSRQAFN